MPTVSHGIYRWLFQRGASLEDFADRLNHFWTCALLLLFAAIISWKQGVSDPIRCWQPAQFTKSFVDYVHTECWNKHTIQYPRDIEEAAELLNMSVPGPVGMNVMNLPILSDASYDEDLLWLTSATTTFYQWLPLYLVFQALMFKLPNLLLYLAHGYSGISFNKLSSLTDGYSNLNVAERSSLAKQISRYIYHWCKQCECPFPWRYLTCAWLITKILFIINIVTQMFYLDSFLRTSDPPYDNSTSYGDVIKDNLFSNNGSLWKQSPKFPRKVFCDFSIRQLMNIQRWNVQCQLPMNEFTEAVYIFLWVWFLIVAVITPISFVIWVLRVALPVFRRRYISKCVQVSQESGKTQTLNLDRFADWVGEDGVMALKLIAANSSELLVADIVHNMWLRRVDETESDSAGYQQMVPEAIPLSVSTGPMYPPLEPVQQTPEKQKEI